jgi:eukaryotic-like serine/threonine-protein kinase
MVIASCDNLLSALRSLQLFSSQQVDEIERELLPHYPDAFDLSEHLVQIDWLTAYQRRLLFEDRWNELAVGPFQILDRLGEGGVGEVFKAWDTVHGRIVALKVLRQHLAANPEAVQELQRERLAVIHLIHPNIIKTYDAAQVDGLHYFAMEYVEGMDLHDYVQRHGPLAVEQACEYVRQTATGLQHAHQAGLVHRDVKPANLFLVNSSADAVGAGPARRRPGETVVKILDWGLARLKPSSSESADATGLEFNAEKGLLIGTADYLAPEQARDAMLVDIRADIYSLGCVFYYLLTGEPPFSAPSLMQKLIQHRDESPPPVQAKRPDVGDELNAVLLRMMAKQPAKRFQIPLLAAAALRRFCSGTAGALASIAASAGGAAFRPSSSASLLRPASNAGVQPPASSANVVKSVSTGELPRSKSELSSYPPLNRK